MNVYKMEMKFDAFYDNIYDMYTRNQEIKDFVGFVGLYFDKNEAEKVLNMFNKLSDKDKITFAKKVFERESYIRDEDWYEFNLVDAKNIRLYIEKY